jgi:hypothetical protein
MSVPNQAFASIRQPQLAHAGKVSLGFALDGLGQKLAGAGSQNIGQGIVDLVRLTQAQNIGSVVHGVSLFFKRFWQARHPPRYAAFLKPASPTFRHSSARHALYPFTVPATGTSRLAHQCARARSSVYENADRSTEGGAQVELAVMGLRYCELSRGTLPPLQTCMT